MDKLVSIAIASYNNAQYIEHCINTVINQQYPTLEILIVDDGSKDDTLSRLEKYKSDSRVKIICKENGGLSSARQMALEKATGDYICFVDADDYLKKTYVEIMLSKLLADKSNVCVCSTKFVTETGEKLERESDIFLCKESEAPIMVTPQKISDFSNQEMMQLHLSDSWNKMYDLNFVRNTGVCFCMPKGLNGTDSLFNRLLALHSPKYSTVKDDGYIHVIYKKSAVHRKKKNLLKSYLTISEKVIRECERIGIRYELEDYISQKLYAQLYMAYLDVFRETVGYKDSLLELKRMYLDYKDFVQDNNVKESGISKIQPRAVKVFVFLLKWFSPTIPVYVRLREAIK